MKYFPKSRIITNQKANPGQFKMANGQIYRGPYYTTFKGESFTGESPTNGISAPLTELPLTAGQSNIDITIENYKQLDKNAYNVGLTSANMSKLQLAQKVKEYVPNLVIIEEQYKEDFDKRNYVVSNEKLEKTGWFCDYSLDAGIKELLQAYKMIHN